MSVESTSSLYDHRTARNIAMHLDMRLVRDKFNGNEPLSKLVMYYLNDPIVLQYRVEKLLNINDSIHTQIFESKDYLKILEVWREDPNNLLLSDNISFVKLGLFVGIKPSFTSLQVAISTKRSDILILLLKKIPKDTNIDFNHLLEDALFSGSLDVVKIILNDSRCSVTNINILIKAVTFGQKNIIQYIWKDMNLKRGELATLLETSCHYGNIHIVELILDKINSQFASVDFYGWHDALMKAVRADHVAIVELLLEKKIVSDNLVSLQASLNNSINVKIVEILNTHISKLKPSNELKDKTENVQKTVTNTGSSPYICTFYCPVHGRLCCNK